MELLRQPPNQLIFHKLMKFLFRWQKIAISSNKASLRGNRYIADANFFRPLKIKNLRFILRPEGQVDIIID